MSLIAARTQGQLPLSIGTALAIESLLGISSEDRKFTKVNSVQSLWVNLATVFRNLTDSMQGQTYLDVSEDELLYTYLEELKQINVTARSHSTGFEVVFYYCYHNSLSSTYPNAKLRAPRTDRQHIYQNSWQTFLKLLVQALSQEPSLSFKFFPREINTSQAGNCAILTHQCIDLLSYWRFSSLALLESHTGALKRRNQWHTKFTSSRDNPRLPFNSFTLQVFGDSEHFSPMPLSLRREVNRLAELRRWTALTTLDKIRHDLEHYADKSLSETLLKLV